MPLAYFHNLATVTNGLVVMETNNLPITEIIIDSRNKAATPFPLFFAITGVNHNGHDYIEEAYAKGIRQFVVDDGYKPSIIAHYNDLNVLQVANTLEALQQFVAFYRSKHVLPVLGITGSNGKTIIKEWMHEFLSRAYYKTVSTPYSYNSQVGVPLAVSLLRGNHKYAIFEAGISKVGEMAKLAQVIQPTHGLFTNIGPAHSKGFNNQQQKIEEKAQLFNSCSTIYYCQDHQLIHATLQRLYGASKRLKTWSFYNQSADYFLVYQALVNENKTSLQMITPTQRMTFLIPFRDSASIENIAHCLVYLLDNGFDQAQLQCCLLQLKSIPMRITLKAGMHGCQVIDDSYTNELASIKVALDFMHQQQKTDKPSKTVILSDILQSATPDQTLYQELAELLTMYQINRLIGIGPVIGHHASLFKMQKSAFFNTVEAFIENKPYFKDEVILVKGARTFQLERIVQAIEKHTHGTILEIDLGALRDNFSFFKTKLQEQTKMMAMVKASSYGSGSDGFEIVSTLQRYGVDYLGVAYMDEGIHLRQQGITIPIMVMNPTSDGFNAMAYYNLEPEIYSLELLEELCCFLTERAIQNIPIHIKLETGMCRLGIEKAAIDQLVIHLKTANLHVASIFSHLAGSEAKDHDRHTLLQAERFLTMTDYIESKLGIKPLKHLLNTNGILRFPQFQFDMVRLGIGLYGVGVSKAIQHDLTPVSRLKTTISQIKSIKKGDSIGYNRQTIAIQDMTIATIPIGYADGFSRSFGCGRGRVAIQNKYCPVVGNICMDMAMVDVSDIQAKRGDEVIIFSAEHPIDELAQRVGTISYELLTQISQRVKRIYYN
ncbi:bifunctional UDP-N-acetylmuramoyl-tripeptide:D-alanyl-D-alanine ligase/alanine racemase [Cardinium endosymbiont of Tipula unca]|uniref:bifunctional UDP-N-acetylmuramoyl-tripeptide:D-alanyl-D-alanine ligase/alanine racemase n=1 Tax=Cardinium endosymbiont of Tipula unca TaxID=3066216 RepID=UPI0030D247BC